jgi:hypothetical protein
MGFIYALATPSMPGLMKVGATERDPADRLAEANAPATWGPPEPYAIVCAFSVPTEFTFQIERALHLSLAARRVNTRREFFRITEDEARAYFAILAQVANPEGGFPRCSDATPPSTAPETGDGLGSAYDTRTFHSLRSPEAKLRAWVESTYTHVPLREKDTGTKLEALYSAYATTVPPVHTKLMGKILFAKMLNAVFPNIGPHKNSNHTVSGIYLLR